MTKRGIRSQPGSKKRRKGKLLAKKGARRGDTEMANDTGIEENKMPNFVEKKLEVRCENKLPKNKPRFRLTKHRTRSIPRRKPYYPGIVTIGTHNVRTWKGSPNDATERWKIEASETATIGDEAGVDILAIQECRIPGVGRKEIVGFSNCRWTLLYSGQRESCTYKNGTGLMLNKRAARALLSFQGISDRIIMASFKARNSRNLCVISAYAPTEKGTKEDKDKFYADLEMAIRNKPTQETLHIAGDFNASIKADANWHPTVGPNAVAEKTNDNDYRLVNFCASHKLMIANTLRPHSGDNEGNMPYTWTWYGPKEGDRKQIDYVLVPLSSMVRRCDVVQDVEYRSDHRMVRTTLFYPLLAQKRTRTPSVRISDLRNEACRKVYEQHLNAHLKQVKLDPSPDTTWLTLREGMLHASAAACSQVSKARNVRWMTEIARKAIEERRRAFARTKIDHASEEENLQAKSMYEQKRKRQILYATLLTETFMLKNVKIWKARI